MPNDETPCATNQQNASQNTAHVQAQSNPNPEEGAEAVLNDQDPYERPRGKQIARVLYGHTFVMLIVAAITCSLDLEAFLSAWVGLGVVHSSHVYRECMIIGEAVLRARRARSSSDTVLEALA